MKIENYYGLKDGKVLSINDVQSGIECDCICPACHSPLVAKKGKIKVHHFAHHSLEECGRGTQTAAHLMAKEIIERRKELYLPPVTFYAIKQEPVLLVSKSRKIELDNVYLEKKVGEIIPDLVVESKGKKLLVEIYVTHSVDSEKEKKIRDLKVSAIEIDLSPFAKGLFPPNLEEIVIDDVYSKRWINNEIVNDIKKSANIIPKKMDVVMRGLAAHIDYCPKNARVWNGKPYANVVDDCVGCVYLDSWNRNEVYCCGHDKNKVDMLLEKYEMKYE